jgi:hypothetical protein
MSATMHGFAVRNIFPKIRDVAKSAELNVSLA